MARKPNPIRLRSKDLDTLEEALYRHTTLDARVLKHVKGGLIVQVGNANGFLPSSLIDTHQVRNPQDYVGKTLNVHLVRLAPQEGILTVSRRSVVELQMGEDRMALLNALKVGSTHEGIVRAVTDFGAFVDLGGLSGLLPLSAWSKKTGAHPSQYVHAGQSLNVTIKSVDNQDGRIRIGLGIPHVSA